MEVCEAATSITGQSFTDTAYFRDVYLRDQLTDTKHQIPSPNYPYPIVQHQNIYENVSNYSMPYTTTTAPSVIASGYPVSTFMPEALHHQHQEYQAASTFDQFYPKEIVKDQIYSNYHHLQQQPQQRIPSQRLPPPYTSNAALSNNISPKNVIDTEYKTSQFTLPNETTTPYVCKTNDVMMYSLPISNEKRECTVNNANNLCNTLILNTDTSLSQWDVNDPKLPKIRQFDTFTMWPQGHCRYAYKKSQSEGAKRHASGWAMRNTNNHNSQILKKSCLGVLLCTSKQCTLAMRPAICDKARRRQEGRPCCMPNCNGRIYIQSCHGHGGYPVTHFWREHGDTIYFQAKGTHDHIRPDLKPVRDTAARRRKQQQQQQQQQGHVEEQVCRKIPRLNNMKNVKTFEQQNEVNARLNSSSGISSNNCSVYSNKTSRILCQNEDLSQFSQTNYKRKINEQNSNTLTSLDQSYSEVNMKKEPIFPGSNPFEIMNEYSNIPTTLKTTPSPIATPPTVMSTIKSPQFPITSNNLLETIKNPSITSPPSLISTTVSPLETKINPVSTIPTTTTILNQSYDNHNLYQYNTTAAETTTTTMGPISGTNPSVIDYKINKSINSYDTFIYNNPQDITEVIDSDYYHRPKHVTLTPFNFPTSTTTTTSALSTSPSVSTSSMYQNHFMNQLMMNSSLPVSNNNNNNNNSTTNMNTTYNNINNNSNTCGTNSESTSCGLNASWSTPSPPTCGLGNSSLFSNNDIRIMHNGVDEISSKKLLSSNDSLKELQSSLQEVNTNLNHWSDNCDPLVNVNDGSSNNNNNNSNTEDMSSYYQHHPTNQYLHNSYYSTYMHKLNLAGYHLTTPNNQYYINELHHTTTTNNNNDSFSPIDQTSLTPSIFMSSSTPVSTMTSKTMNKLYRSTPDNHPLLYHTPTSRLLRTTEENGTNIDNINSNNNNNDNNSNSGFSYIAPIPFYLNSSSDSRSTRTDSSSDTSHCKQIMI